MNRSMNSGVNKASASTGCPMRSAQTASWPTTLMHFRASTASRGPTLVTDSFTTGSTRSQTSAGTSLGENRLIVPLTDSPERTGAPNDHPSATRSAAKLLCDSTVPGGFHTCRGSALAPATDRRRSLGLHPECTALLTAFRRGPWLPLRRKVLHTQRALPGTSGRPSPAGLRHSGCNSVLQHRGGEVRGCPTRRRLESEFECCRSAGPDRSGPEAERCRSARSGPSTRRRLGHGQHGHGANESPDSRRLPGKMGQRCRSARSLQFTASVPPT